MGDAADYHKAAHWLHYLQHSSQRRSRPSKDSTHCWCSRNVRPVNEWISKEWKKESNLKCHLCEWRKEVAWWEFSTKGTTQLSAGTHWKGSHRSPEEIDEEVCIETCFAGDLGNLSLGFSDAKDFSGLSGPSGGWGSRRQFGGGRHEDFWTSGLSLDLLWHMIDMVPSSIRAFLWWGEWFVCFS